MLKLLLIDDEPLALRQLQTYAERTEGVEVLAACHSTAQARPYAEEADAIVLDIQMPDENGMDFVRSLAAPPLLVFTTAHPQYAVDGFRVGAVDYLLKPFSLEEFRRAMEKLKTRLQERKAAEILSRKDDDLFFKTDYKTVKVNVGDIRYVESMSEYLKIYLTGQDHPLVVLYSLKRLSEQLDPKRFVRIHRSYLVNLGRIREFSKTAVRLDCGLQLPVSDSYRAALSKLLN